MIKDLRQKARWLYHPVTIFLLIQVLWVSLMVVWVRWYIEKSSQLRQIAERFRAQTEIERLGWLPETGPPGWYFLLLPGCRYCRPAPHQGGGG